MIQKKICLLGAFAVGKTSLVRRYVHSIFSDKYLTTVGVKIDKRVVRIGDRPQDEVNLIIWDLYGEDEFQKVQTSYLRGAAGLLLVADGTRAQTLNKALELQALGERAIGKVPFSIILNKSDLRAEWELTDAQIAAVRARGIDLILASAKTGEGVDLLFTSLCARMLAGRPS